MIKLKLVLNEDVSLLLEQTGAWDTKMKPTENFLKTFKNINTELVGSYNEYTITKIQGTTVSDLQFYNDSSYFVPIPKQGQSKSAYYEFDPTNKRLILYKGNKDSTPIDGYLINKNGVAVYQPEQKQTSTKKNSDGTVIDVPVDSPSQEKILNTITGVLDITGLIEWYGIGAASDLIATMIHLYQKNYFDAALSAFGVIPFASAAIIPIKAFIRSNRQAAKLVEQIGDLSTPEQVKAAVEFWNYLLKSGKITPETMEKIATGFKSVSDWISKNRPKPDNGIITDVYVKVDDYFKAINVTLDMMKQGRRAPQLVDRANLLSKLVKGITSPVETFKLLTKDPATFGKLVLKTVNVIGFPTSTIKAMQRNLRNKFIRNIIKDTSKVETIISTSAQNTKAINELMELLKKSNDISLTNLVNNSITRQGTARNATQYSTSQFATRFIDIMKQSNSETKEQLSEIFSNWMIQTKNPYYISFIDNTANQLKTLAGATSMGLGDFWRTFKDNFWNIDNGINLLGSAAVSNLTPDQREKLGMADDSIVAVVGASIAGWFKSVIGYNDSDVINVTKATEQFILQDEMDQEDKASIPTK